MTATATGELSRRLPALGDSRFSVLLDRPEMYVHALAQAHESVGLELRTNTRVSELRALANAYGLRDRIQIGRDDGGTDGRFVVAGTEVSPADGDGARGTLADIVEGISAGLGPAPAPARSSHHDLAGERVVILTNYPAHYRLPLFDALEQELAAVGAELAVLFLAHGPVARPWLASSQIDFSHDFVPSLRVPRKGRALLVPAGLEQMVRACRPTVVLSGGLSPFVSDRASRVARELGSAFGIWSGETAVMTTAKSSFRRRLRQHLVRRADFAIAYGARSAAYLYALRTDLPLVIGRNSAPTTATSPKDRNEGSVGPLRIVSIGDLADARKGVDVALAALRLLPTADVRLSVIGGGRLLGELANQGRGDSRVEFLGSLSPDRVTAELAQAEILLFPTRSDVFGLALVEAMGAEATPIVSRAAGATDDLAVDGHNSVVVNDHDPRVWAAAIDAVISDGDARRSLARRARATVESRWTIDHAAQAMIAGLRLGVRAHAAKDGLR